MRRAASLAIASLLLAAPRAPAQDVNALTTVQALYESASYEEALAQLEQVPGTGSAGARAEQYRAFCLLALGRIEEATTAVTRAVAADPLLVPAPSEASPRVLTFFADARRKVLPEVAKTAYAAAKAALTARDFPAAAGGFARVLSLIDSAGAPDKSELAELRLLAREFLDLTEQRQATVSLPPAPNPAGNLASVSPLPSAPDTRGPLAITQVFPRWDPKGLSIPIMTGRLHLEIGETGAVTSATVTTPTDPSYDQLLLAAARQWRYQPAMLADKPVRSEKDITYVLRSPSSD